MTSGPNENTKDPVPIRTVTERLVWATASCQEAHMRLTPVREAILSFLASQRMPVTLETVAQAEGVRGRCDPTTVYRTLMMFKEARLLRLVGTPHKVSHFVLNVPGESNHFLICQHCGQMAELPAVKALTLLEQRLAEARGFSAIYHELEVYGICPSCRGKPPSDAAKEKGMTLKIGVKSAHSKAATPRGCHASA